MAGSGDPTALMEKYARERDATNLIELFKTFKETDPILKKIMVNVSTSDNLTREERRFIAKTYMNYVLPPAGGRKSRKPKNKKRKLTRRR